MATQTLDVFTVDAFTDVAFGGNPAAVVPLNQPLSEETLQKIATEMNLSETAFLSPISPDDKKSSWTTGRRFRLRWLTPTNEVKLCGHATLASAHALFFCLNNTCQELEFETLSGVLLAKKNGSQITLDFPLNPPTPLDDQQTSDFEGVLDSFKKQHKISEVLLSLRAKKLVVVLDKQYSRNDLETLNVLPNVWLQFHDGSQFYGVVVTLEGELHSGSASRGLEEYHFVSRYFGPWNGIPEDPVTGSAHTVLGPYWADKLGLKELKCRQCSKRGGNLELLVRNDGRIDITGKAVTILKGTITI